MRRGGSWAWVGIAALGAAALAVVVLGSGSQAPPFGPDSSAPDGYGAVAILLEDAGVQVDAAAADEPGALEATGGRGLVVSVAEYLSDQQLEQVRDAAVDGATVVLAAESGFIRYDRDQLVRTPALPVTRGFCDIAELEGLESVDDFDGAVLTPFAEEQSCFGGGLGSLVTRERVGAGSVISLSSPYLWANARLQPDKEEGGRALDNGAMAVALLGALDSVSFIEAVPSSGVTPEGSQNPVSLMPLAVKMAVLQAVGAFLLYAWWRSRRLGPVVGEELPVEVAGSELVEAVGGLLRRNGTTARAAEVLRRDVRRDLAARLGVPPEADRTALLDAVAARSARDRSEVARILVDGPVSTPDDLVALSRSLDELHSEVLHVQPTA